VLGIPGGGVNGEGGSKHVVAGLILAKVEALTNKVSVYVRKKIFVGGTLQTQWMMEHVCIDNYVLLFFNKNGNHNHIQFYVFMIYSPYP
jgi:hypothetical protein